MTKRRIGLRRMSRFALAVAGLALLAGCQDSSGGLSSRSLSPIPNDTLALMQQKGVTRDAPVLIRTYKQEAELEIWKRKPDGQYVYLKTFPMCRWSGQLGPKLREGDRQVPEGFYTITPGQMNPNSHYYLSFNVGYPNAYDRAHGATGGDIMVHGICSSAGCFSMTNDQIAEIYAIAREAFNGGQRGIQMQSMPFKMTAENLAKHRLDPHIAFWKMLKQGADNFEVTKQEPQVGVCGKQYVFNATPAGGARLDPAEACPPLIEDAQLKSDVAEKAKADEVAVADLVAKGVKPVQLVYADGGQNPVFYAKFDDVSRPDALAQGPTEVALDDHGKPARSAPVKMAAAGKSVAPVTAPLRPEAAPAAPAPIVVASADDEQPFYKRMIGMAPPQPATPKQSSAPVVSVQPADASLPARRSVKPEQRTASDAVRTPQPAEPAAAPVAVASAERQGDQPFYKRWLGLNPDAPTADSTAADSGAPEATTPAATAAPEPAEPPLAPRRKAATATAKAHGPASADPAAATDTVPLPPRRKAASTAEKTHDPAKPQASKRPDKAHAAVAAVDPRRGVRDADQDGAEGFEALSPVTR